MLNSYPKATFENVQHLAVAIKEITNCHTGIFYRISDENLRLLHFETDQKLSDEPANQSYMWVVSGLNPRNQKVVAAICRDIALKNANGKTGIPYGFRFDGDYFSPAGDFVGDSKENGLTCATFILAAFRTCSFELLDTVAWPTFGEMEDFYFQKNMTAILRDRTTNAQGVAAGDAHAKILEKQHASPRFRPEHVTAGAGSKKIPLSYEVAVRLGTQILADVKAASASAKIAKDESGVRNKTEAVAKKIVEISTPIKSDDHETDAT